MASELPLLPGLDRLISIFKFHLKQKGFDRKESATLRLSIGQETKDMDPAF